jgi:ribulose-5-phosphate 4-epimerase/fuculose-1-phosphate aldolase
MEGRKDRRQCVNRMQIMKKYPDVNAVVHSHSEDVLPYTVIEQEVEPVYHMAGFLGTYTHFSLPSPALPSVLFLELAMEKRQMTVLV